jgi:hypothetical protein
MRWDFFVTVKRLFRGANFCQISAKLPFFQKNKNFLKNFRFFCHTFAIFPVIYNRGVKNIIKIICPNTAKGGKIMYRIDLKGYT